MQTVILLHGALGSAADLAPLATALKDAGVKVHMLTFSGHGNETFKESFSIEQFSQELESLLQSISEKEVTVFGYSMGGFVALNLAAKHPGLIKRIITLGTKFNWSKEAVEKETALLNPEAMQQKIPAYAKSLEDRHGSRWQETVMRTAGLMRGIHEKQYLSPDSLKSITTPVLIGLGDKDKMVTTDETLTVYKTLPNAAMYMLPNTKHPIETANPALLSHIILNFIKS